VLTDEQIRDAYDAHLEAEGLGFDDNEFLTTLSMARWAYDRACENCAKEVKKMSAQSFVAELALASIRHRQHTPTVTGINETVPFAE